MVVEGNKWGSGNVRLGHKRDILRHHICGAIGHVRYGPIADIACLFDHLVSDGQYLCRDVQAERSGGL